MTNDMSREGAPSADTHMDQSTSIGEDDGGTEQDGADGHLHDDQKSPATEQSVVGENDGKAQDAARAGREGFDPNAGAE